MMKRDNMSAVIDGLQKEQGLLAAFLEATNKVDCRTLYKPVPIGDRPKPVNVEAEPHQVEPSKSSASSFVLQPANLVRSSDRSLAPEEQQHNEG